MLTAVLDEMSDKCQRKVASRGVALHDDVFGREADDIYEVMIPRERVEKRSWKRIALREWRCRGQPILNGQVALHLWRAILDDTARDDRREVAGVRGQRPVVPAVEVKKDLLARSRRRSRGDVAVRVVNPIAGNADGFDALFNGPVSELADNELRDRF